MKFKALLFLLLAALLPLSAPRSAQAADVSFDYFYDALLPYGEWIEVEGYGFCWRPREVDAAWTPYSDGYWAFTDAGWTWVGYEDFAGIVYHYGRWMSVENEGWCWVPDYEWGPAWVSWRNSDDYIGWAPLPPRAYWQPEIGISTWADTAYDIGPAFYSFCRVRDFGAPVLRLVLINRTRNVVIIRNTVNITNITYNLYSGVPVIYNGGPSYVVINRRSERPVPALKLVRQTHFDRKEFRGGQGGFSPNARIVGNQLFVNAPIVAAPAQPAFLKDKAKKVYRADKVANGWAGVKDGKEREELRQHFRRETKGLTPYTAPAKAVVAADLKVVPAQADPDAVLPGFAGKGARGKGDRQPPTAVAPAVPGPVTNPAVEQPPVAKPVVVAPAATPVVDPRATAPREHEKGGGKIRGGATPPVVAAPGQGSVIDPRAAGKTKPDNGRPKSGRDHPVVTLPPDEPIAPANTGVPAEPRDGRASRPKGEAPAGGFHPPGDVRRPIAGEGQPARPVGVDPAVVPQAADEAARMAREQAEAQKKKADLEKRGAASVEAAPAQIEQERAAKRREAEAAAAALREKHAAQAAAIEAQKAAREAAEAQRAAQAGRDKLQADQESTRRQRDTEAAAARQKQMEAQRQAEAARQAEQKRQQAEAQSQERLKQQQEQIAEQRRQMQIEQQKAAQEAARQQAGARAREQQAEQQRAAQEAARQQQKEQQRAAQDAARQQAAERAREQQAEQQRAAQEAARQQQKEQQRAAQAAAALVARQQAEAQRAAQEAAARQQVPPPPQGAPQQPAQDPRRGEKDKDKDKDKGR